MYAKISPIHNFLIIFLHWHWDHFIWNEFCLWLRTGFKSIQINPTSCCAYRYGVFTWEVLFQNQLKAYAKKWDNLLGEDKCPRPCCIAHARTLEGSATHCWCGGAMLQPPWWPPAPRWQAKTTGQCLAPSLPIHILDRPPLFPTVS